MGKVPTGSAWLAELAAGAPRGIAAGKTHTLLDERLLNKRIDGVWEIPEVEKTGDECVYVNT